MRLAEWIKSRLDDLRAMLSTDHGNSAAKVSETRSSDKLELKFLSDPANVSVARKSIEEFCQGLGLDVPACEEIGLVVNEALANVIRHAYAGAMDRPVEISVRRKDAGVTIDIRDWGNGLDPSPLTVCQRDPLAPGGVGLVCIRRLMDDVKYSPQGDGMLLSLTRTTRGSLIGT